MNASRRIFFVVVLLAPGGIAAAQATTRVSLRSNGVQGNFPSGRPAVSADGRFVVYDSDASNLVAHDTNGATDVFVYDRATRHNERVSVDSASIQGNGNSGDPSISPDGRFVAFTSDASNLVAGDTNGVLDAFVHDRSTGVTERVSIDSSGVEGNSLSYTVRLSADGQFVAFGSYSSNLVAGDTNGVDDVFVHDRSSGVTERVSVDSTGAEGNSYSNANSISADGQVVVFDSYATNLVAGDTNHGYDVFVHDRTTGITERISVDSSGKQGNDYSFAGMISADDQVVSFESRASNLVAGDTNGAEDIFVHDRTTGVTERASVDSSGAQAKGDNIEPAISADGDAIVFTSDAPNLVAGDSNAHFDVFVHHRSTGITERVSVASSGAQGNDDSSLPVLSADGDFVAFNSWATNLVGGDTNATADVFARGRWLTLEADPLSPPPGATLAFTTWTGTPSAASLLVATAVNGTPVFLPIVFGSFDGAGEWVVTGTVPSGLSGITMDVAALGFVATGKVDLSNGVTVSFQ